MFISTPTPVANLALAGWSRILRVTGRVVATNEEHRAIGAGPPGMRIEFDGLSDEAGEQLAQLLQQLGAASSEAAKPQSSQQPGESAKLVIQVRGLLMEMGDLQQELDAREREIAELKAALSTKESALERSEKDRSAAESALQRLSTQLAGRR